MNSSNAQTAKLARLALFALTHAVDDLAQGHYPREQQYELANALDQLSAALREQPAEDTPAIIEGTMQR